MRVRITSLNYDDFLAVTLPGWVRVCPPGTLQVVTAKDDEATQRVAAEQNVPVFITDAWTRHDASFRRDMSHWNGLWRQRGHAGRQTIFNKALALDEAFGFAGDLMPPPAVGEPCLSIDADCLPVGTLPDESSLHFGVIYGCKRFAGRPDLTRGDEDILKGRICQSQHRRATCVGGGYFQLFRYEPGMRFGSYPAADGYDYDFAFGFRRGVELESIHVLHFGETHKNWEGRVTPRWQGASQ